MELKEFIKEAITAIVDSMIELNSDLAEKDVHISPRYAEFRDGKGYSHEAECCVHQVEFRVLVEISDEKKKEAGVGFKVISGSIEKTGKATNGTEISFSIPLIYPTFPFIKFVS